MRAAENLGRFKARHAEATAQRITYSGLVESTDPEQMPGQLQIPTPETEDLS